MRDPAFFLLFFFSANRQVQLVPSNANYNPKAHMPPIGCGAGTDSLTPVWIHCKDDSYHRGPYNGSKVKTAVLPARIWRFCFFVARTLSHTYGAKQELSTICCVSFPKILIIPLQALFPSHLHTTPINSNFHASAYLVLPPVVIYHWW